MREPRGETVVDLVMTFVLPVVGGVGCALLLRSTTELPLWLCVILGIPIGTVAAWMIFLGIALAIAKLVIEPIEQRQMRRRQMMRDRFNQL